MKIQDLFRKRVIDINTKGYTPKFKVGDIILNKKFIIVRRVIDVISVDSKNSNSQYMLRDLHNPLLQTSKVGQREVYKECVRIDDYYDRIDERVAKVLYGFKE